MSFPAAIDQTPALASEDPRDMRAPLINANEAFDNQVEDAKVELEVRKRLFVSGFATMNELKASRRRLNAVKSIEGHVAHGIGYPAILAAINNMGANVANLGANVANLGARMDNMDANVANLGANVANLGARMDNMDANMANLGANVANLGGRIDNMGAIMDARRFNDRARRKNREGLWVPLVVECEGHHRVGSELANYPASPLALMRMTMAQLTALEQSFNLPVGHFGNDQDEASVREEVRNYLFY